MKYFVRCGADEAMHLPGWRLHREPTSDAFPVARPDLSRPITGLSTMHSGSLLLGREYVLNSGIRAGLRTRLPRKVNRISSSHVDPTVARSTLFIEGRY
jgi:hypothetical protein